MQPPFGEIPGRPERQPWIVENLLVVALGLAAALPLGFALAMGVAPALGVGSAPAFAASGGAGMAPPPKLSAVRCIGVPEHPCVDRMWVEPGGAVLVTGSYLTAVRKLVFLGAAGRADDVYAPARPRRSGSVAARVPEQARSGPVAVVNDAGIRSRRLPGLVIDDAAAEPPVPSQTGPQPAIGTAVSKPRKIFYGALRKAVFSFRIASAGPTDVTVNLLRLSDGVVVRSWQRPQVPANVVQKVVWDGRGTGGVQPEGFYTFRAVAGTATGSAATPGAASSEDAFAFYGHMFPVAGKHDYGGEGAGFGAGRTGHRHQGQDVFARCGTPLLAARAGKVVYKGYHSAAGYYLVVHGSSGMDYVYAHLRQPASVPAGARVYTGQQIGEVGDSGNARGCHLHFELWSGPGWYKGGRPFDPLADLRRWDSIS